MDKQSLTILAVEDNRDNRELISRMLEFSGYSVIATKDGEEALKCLNVMRVHLMLIDINLPKMNGIELLKKIRENDAFASIPAIAITANTATAPRIRCIEAGFDEYLIKPITRKELNKHIEEVIANITLPTDAD